MFASARAALRLSASVALITLAVPGLAEAESLKAHYAISLIGLPIGSASVTGSVEPSSYRMEVTAQLSGLASILSSSRAASTASGTVAGNRIVPATYATTSANAKMTRTIRMAMGGGAVTGVDIAPPFDSHLERVPVTDADRHNILDPLSALVMTLPPGSEAGGPSACNRRLPIFDGAVRFDIALTYVGTRHVEAKGYVGNVAVCAARYLPVSGHVKDSKASKFMADNQNLEVWVAPVAGTNVVFPFRISVRTAIGTTVIEADEFRTDATHASLR